MALNALSGALRRVAGAVVDFEDVPAKEAAQKSPPQKATVTPPSPIPPPVDPSMLETLQKQVMARSSPYTTLVESAEKLSSVIPDDSTRLKAAYAMISGQRSVSSIVQAIDVHVSDLEGVRMRFKQASDQRVREKAKSLRDRAASLDASVKKNAETIEALQEQIKKLTDECSRDMKESIDLNDQATAEELEITKTVAEFDRAVDYLKTDLQAKKDTLAAVLSSQ